MRLFPFLAAGILVSAAMAEEPPKEPPKDPPKDEAAEALFKKLEAKYAEAKTVQYTVEMLGKDKNDTIKMTFAVAAKAGNMLRMAGEGEIAGTAVKMTVVCDGTKLETRFNGLGRPAGKASANAASILRGGMVRAGVFEAIDSMDKESLGKMDEQYAVTLLKLGEDEKVGDKAMKVLTWKVSVKGKDWTWTQKAWVDEETLTIVKREGKGSDGRTELETYTDTKFDGELKDEDFKVTDGEKDK